MGCLLLILFLPGEVAGRFEKRQQLLQAMVAAAAVVVPAEVVVDLFPFAAEILHFNTQCQSVDWNASCLRFSYRYALPMYLLIGLIAKTFQRKYTSYMWYGISSFLIINRDGNKYALIFTDRTLTL